MTASTTPPTGDSLGGSISWFGLSYLLSIMGFLALNALAARTLGTEDFGRFVVIYTVSLVAGQVGLLGVHRAGVREVARLERFDLPEATALKDDLRTVSLTSLPLVALAVGIGTAVAMDSGGGSVLSLGIATIGLSYLSGQQKLASHYLRGLGRVRSAGLLEGRSGGGLITVLQAALLGASMAAGLEPQLGTVIALLALAYLVPIIWGRVVISGFWPRSRRRLNHVRRLAVIWRRDWRFFVLSTASSGSQYVEVWLAGALLVATDSSYFSAGHRLASLLVLPLASLQVVTSPVISRLWHRQEPSTLQSLVRTGASVASVCTLLLTIPLLLAPNLVMEVVFGSAFEQAGTVLLIVAIGMFGNVVSGLCGAVLSMTGHEGTSAAVTVASLLLRVSVGLWAASQYGLIGLAISFSVITVVHNAALALLAVRLTGIVTVPTVRPNPRLFLRLRG
ncbi:MAG: lipopolysaccharide biosynthesis protein [Ornithinimicrobium sp.]